MKENIYKKPYLRFIAVNIEHGYSLSTEFDIEQPEPGGEDNL